MGRWGWQRTLGCIFHSTRLGEPLDQHRYFIESLFKVYVRYVGYHTIPLVLIHDKNINRIQHTKNKAATCTRGACD